MSRGSIGTPMRLVRKGRSIARVPKIIKERRQIARKARIYKDIAFKIPNISPERRENAKKELILLEKKLARIKAVILAINTNTKPKKIIVPNKIKSQPTQEEIVRRKYGAFAWKVIEKEKASNGPTTRPAHALHASGYERE